jgi:hypothetical protein
MSAPGAAPEQRVATGAQPPVRVIFVIETTYAAAVMWGRTREWCFENILRHLEHHAAKSKQQQQQQQQQPQEQELQKQHQLQQQPVFQVAVVSYGTAGPFSPHAVESSGWTSDAGRVRRWLDRLRFLGGGTLSTALIEALAAAVYLSKHPYPGGALPPGPPGGTGAAGAGAADGTPPPPHTHIMLLASSVMGRQDAPWPFPHETKAARLQSGFYTRLAAALPPAHAKGVAEAAGAAPTQPSAADLTDVATSLPDHGVTLSCVASLRVAPMLQGKILLTLRHQLPAEPHAVQMPSGGMLILSPQFRMATEALRAVLLKIKQLQAARRAKAAAAAAVGSGGGGSIGMQPSSVSASSIGSTAAGGGAGTPVWGAAEQQQGGSAAAGGQQQQQQQRVLNAQNMAAVAAAAGAAARLAGMPASGSSQQAQRPPLQQQQQQQQQQQPQAGRERQQVSVPAFVNRHIYV